MLAASHALAICTPFLYPSGKHSTYSTYFMASFPNIYKHGPNIVSSLSSYTHTPICTSKLYNLLLKGILKKKVSSCTDHSFPEIATNMATWSIEYHKGIGWIFDLFLFKTMRAPECTIHLSPNRPQMLCKRELLWTGAG